MERPYPSDSFVSFYREKVHPVATQCADGFKTILKLENGEIDENHKDMEPIKTKTDATAIFYIGHMIGDIERAIVHGTSLNFLNSIQQIHGTLNSDSYWKNVWNNDLSSQEAKNLRELGNLMKELLTKL